MTLLLALFLGSPGIDLFYLGMVTTEIEPLSSVSAATPNAATSAVNRAGR